MNRSMDRNHGASDGDGQDSALSRMRVSLRQEQRVWIEKEAARRGVANNVIMRELVENALSGQTAVPQEPSSVPPVSRSSSRVPGADVLEAVLVDSPLPRSDGVDSGCGAGGGAFVEAEPVAEALPTGVPPVPEVEASPSVGSPSVARSNGRAYSDPRLAQVVGDRRSAGARSPRVVSEGPVAPRLPSAVGRSTVLPGVGRGTRLPPGVGRSRVPAVAVSGVPMDGIGQPLPGDPGALPPGTSTSLVLSGGNVASESGIVVMLPDPHAPGGLRAVQVPLASYVKQARGVGSGFFEFVGLGSSAFRAGLMGFVILAVILFVGYLGSTLVANRYQFHEVQVAPGRSQFYRIDRWTGEMQRCQTDYRTARPPGVDGLPPPVC